MNVHMLSEVLISHSCHSLGADSLLENLLFLLTGQEIVTGYRLLALGLELTSISQRLEFCEIGS